MKKSKYNIAFLWHGARNIGGGEYSLFYLIQGLRKDLFNLLVIYAEENNLIEKYREAGIETLKIPLSPRIISTYRDGIRYNPFHLCACVWHLIGGIVRLARILHNYNIDMLHPHDNLSKIIGGIAARCAGVKVVTHCRDELKNGFVEKVLKYYQYFVMDKIITVSNKVRNLFILNGRVPARVVTIYNGIDPDLFNPDKIDNSARAEMRIENGCTVVGTVAVFDSCKGHVYLFEALERLKSEGLKNFKCLVVGDGREKENLVDFVEKSRLSKEVVFLGYRKDIPRLLRVLDILVIPSVQEAFPRVALEAMAMRVPVIATNVGGLPEAILDGKTGIIIPPKDIEALCNALKYLIENPKLREEMGRNGRRRVEKNFTIEENVVKTEQVYLQILKG